jgi:hypothetical protein
VETETFFSLKSGYVSRYFNETMWFGFEYDFTRWALPVYVIFSIENRFLAVSLLCIQFKGGF